MMDKHSISVAKLPHLCRTLLPGVGIPYPFLTTLRTPAIPLVDVFVCRIDVSVGMVMADTWERVYHEIIYNSRPTYNIRRTILCRVGELYEIMDVAK